MTPKTDFENKWLEQANARAFEAYPVRVGTMPFCIQPQDANESLRMCYSEGYLQALDDICTGKIDVNYPHLKEGDF